MPSQIMTIGEPHSVAPSFEVPLEMLAACHGRVQAQCDVLRRLGPHVDAHGVDAQAREAARSVMRYFDQAAPQHHADEERDLFPALLESMAGSDPVCLRELTAALSAEHRALEALWRALRDALQRMLDASQAPDAALVEDFVARYLAHLQREDDELLPMAARLLDDDALARVGRAMRLRRGIERVD